MDIKRVIGTVILIVAALVVGLASWWIFGEEGLEPGDAPYWWTGENMSGKVEKLSPTEIVVTTPKGAVTFTMNKLTKVSMTAHNPLAVGANVKIKYKDLKTEKLAKGIFVLKGEATTASPAAPGSPAAAGSPGAAPASPSASGSPAAAPASPAADASPAAASPSAAPATK